MNLTLLASLLLSASAALPAWDFSSPEDLKAWVPNGQLADVAVADGVLHARATGWDPSFQCRTVEIPTTPWQYVVVRLKADKPGNGELFWSKDLDGKYSGLAQEKSTPFKVKGDGNWEEIPLFPFWQKEGTIRQFRFDVYDDTTFDIDWIRILDWGTGQAPVADVYRATFENGDPGDWRIHPNSSDYFAPPLDLPLDGRGWVSVCLSAAKDTEGCVLWAAKDAWHVQSESFGIRGDGRSRHYNVEVGSYATWRDRICAFGLRLPQEAGIHIESVAIVDAPEGPGELAVNYFGFENGANRAGRACGILAQFENHGGSQIDVRGAQLRLPAGLRMEKTPEKPGIDALEYADLKELRWEVSADQPGRYEVTLDVENIPASEAPKAVLRFLPPVEADKADYVPAPRPVQTDIDLCMYYFPGWATDSAWDCIRRVAPNRKPLLGYYDESRVEIVDWQIKWAVENGIKCYLVDWYWNQGNQSLVHWFEAYRKARYRDQLQVAIMWANHNPPGSNSREDWRKVTQEWIDRYFNLPGYYRLNGKPALFLWAPSLLRNDLGSSTQVKEALDESQAMARAAGYPGIEFVVVNDDTSPALVKQLEAEGYAGATNYHEWGRATELSRIPKRARYEDVVSTAPETWEKRDAVSSTVTYYPDVETGWDPRPWHGTKSLIVEGRSPALFEQTLQDAKKFSEAHGKRMLVLGPTNEWGEGSYVEPCTEFDFDMMEAIRKVFAKGDPASWPVNIGPADVGLGAYDFPPAPAINTWDFEKDPGGWNGMMGVSPLQCGNGALHFTATSDDPAITVSLRNVYAGKYPKAVIRMKITGLPEGGSASQLFWAAGGGGTSEASSISFAPATDGEFHTYTLDLAARPRWRGRIATLRFDPCSTRGAEVFIDSFSLEK